MIDFCFNLLISVISSMHIIDDAGYIKRPHIIVWPERQKLVSHLKSNGTFINDHCVFFSHCDEGNWGHCKENINLCMQYTIYDQSATVNLWCTAVLNPKNVMIVLIIQLNWTLQWELFFKSVLWPPTKANAMQIIYIYL